MNDTRRPKPAKAVAKRSSVRRSPAFTRDEANLIGFYRLDGGKISVMLEECKPPYAVRPVNIGVGDPFKRSVVKIAEDNRMPAIVDPDGPGGKPISIFESGAILRYPSRKTGIFCPVGERRRIEVDQWLFWQMAGLGSLSSQAHHFSQYQYMREKTPHAIIRHADEVNRAPRRDQQASEGPSPCRHRPIADGTCRRRIVPHRNRSLQFDDISFPKDGFERVCARSSVRRGYALGAIGAGASSAT
ncbi:MAG: glutathione S-transferase family protein [Parvibaculum sp.]